MTPALNETTVAVGGVACRILCDYLKPILWATELHPEFVSNVPSDVTLTVTYDDGYYERGLPWIAEDSVPDAPHISGDGAILEMTTAYYRAHVDAASRRIDVSLAMGFRVDTLMRNVYALLLGERGGLLLRGASADEDHARVVVGGDAFVAIVPAGDGYVWSGTPFHPDEATPPSPTPRALHALVVRGHPRSPANALAAIAPHLCVIDRRPAGVARMLDITARLLTTIPALTPDRAGDTSVHAAGPA